MDFKEMKIETELEVLQRDEKPYYNLEQQSPTNHGRVHNTAAVQHRKVMEIAKVYANLYCGMVPCSFAVPNFKGKTVIFECPRCMQPCRCTSHSAFFTLLCHISRRHPESSQALIADVISRHASFLQYMTRKIVERTKRNCFKKLRSLEHRKTFLSRLSFSD